MILVRVLFQTVFLALGQVWANKVRAMLTALGIIIGVSSVIAVVGAMGGLERFVLSQVESFGARKMWVWGFVPRDKRTSVSWDDVKVTVSEGERIVENAPSIDAMTPMTESRYDVRAGNILARAARVTGVRPAWHIIEKRTVISGRELMPVDEEEARNVCLVNEKAIDELRLPRDPKSEYILIDGQRFLIVGVLETKEVSPMFGGGESQTEIFVPFATAKKMDPYDWTYIMAQLTRPEAAQDALAEVRFILRQARGLGPEDEDTFQTEIMQQHINNFKAMSSGVTAIAGGIVSVSLLVGGIGIMNIMLVSVSERTREIGLRKAMGARPSIVLAQFLVEAIVLCLVGGLIGIALGQGLIAVLRVIPNSPLDEASVPSWAVALALGFSAAVGVIFGMFPAIKAARLDPINALRHE